MRIDRALQTGTDQQVTDRIGDIERRVAELGDQVAGRPAAKRGKATADHIEPAPEWTTRPGASTEG